MSLAEKTEYVCDEADHSGSIIGLGLFPLLALWGNKNWPHSMKVKKMETFQDKNGLMGCKWSSLNAPSTENPLSHSLLELGDFPFPIIGPLG